MPRDASYVAVCDLGFFFEKKNQNVLYEFHIVFKDA